MENSSTNRTITRSKSKFQGTQIIRDNQPLKFRQNPTNYNDNNVEEEKVVEEDEDDVWEEGYIQPSNNNGDRNEEGVKIEFDKSSDFPTKKRVKRATALDKEYAELVHKAHLLCLVARGRVIDAACDDPLIQAALLSLLPPHLLKISEASKLTANALTPLVSWFHKNFHVRIPNSAEKPFHSALENALATQGGSPEEVAALSVALFRALNFTTRFVSVLDVVSLKPGADSDELSYSEGSKERNDIFNSSTLMVSKMDTSLRSSTKLSGSSAKSIHDSLAKAERGLSPAKDLLGSNQLQTSDKPADETNKALEDAKHRKRKGDLEFEMQLQMAISTTSLVAPKTKPETSSSGSPSSPLVSLSPAKKLKRISEESPSSSHGVSTAIGSRKVGAPLYWAEVYCSGENMTGKWVQIDAVNAIVDGELKVEAAVTACKKSLRYVVAFAGSGAKDVTRRYCAKWYKISPNRINSEWWDAVIAPLKKLESRATGGMFPLHEQESKSTNMAAGNLNNQNQSINSVQVSSSEDCLNVDEDRQKSSTDNSSIHSRSTLEDMELATRALTEPLPTNQQAYRNHPLYAIEKFLTKYQILHPKDPVLGFCSGHAVYPRTCVQMLHTKERWLREGLQVKENERPAKMVKSSSRNRREKAVEIEDGQAFLEDGFNGLVSLYGKWQTEPLILPAAVNGIVPKNERGQVDVWSEKCLPPGTVHLRFPRLVPVAKKLGINFAPAMVGFDFQNGRSVPVYEGIVVCTEFRDVILEAYAEEENRRDEEERKKEERQALSRWYQLLSSMVIRQRLNNAYMNNSESETIAEPEPSKSDSKISCAGTADVDKSSVPPQQNVHKSMIPVSDGVYSQNHEHVFLTDDESFDEDNMTRTKRCHCGVTIQVEEL